MAMLKNYTHKRKKSRDFSLENRTDFRMVVQYCHLMFGNFQEACEQREMVELT